MRDIKTIVVPLDGEPNSERALPLALDLAQQLGARVLLLSSVTALDERHFRTQQLQTLADGLERVDEGVSVDVVHTDDVSAPIEEAAMEQSMIVMATSGKVGLHDGHIGSIAEKVVREVHEPVFLVGPAADARLDVGKVVVPVDGSAAAEAAIDLAADWADEFGVPLWVVTVVTPDQQAAAAKAGVTAEHGYVKRLADRVSDRVDGEFEVLHGDDPVESLIDFLGDDSLCVMTTTGKSGISRIVIGSVAAGVVRRSQRPVLVVTSTSVAPR